MKHIKKYKHIVNGYDIGKRAQTSGNQGYSYINTNNIYSTPGYVGYNNDAQSIKDSMVPQSLSQLSGTIASVYPVLQSYSSTLSNAATTNVTNAIKSGLVDSSGLLTQTGVDALAKQGITASVGEQAGSKLTEQALRGSGNSVAGNILSGASLGLSAIGALNSGINTVQAFNNFKNRIDSSDMLNSSSRNTQTKYGVSYDTYGGFDKNGVLKYTNAQNDADITNSVLSSGSLGASIGSVLGPIGAGAGFLLGGITGGLFGSSSAKKRLEKVQQDIKSTTQAIDAYNLQSETEAGSKGLRNKFYSQHAPSYGIFADKGKNVGQSSYSNQYGDIVTPSGVAKGKIQGYASPDEGEIDMSTGETIYNGNPNPYVKDKREDVVPVGVSGNSDEGAFDRDIAIPGHQRDLDGIMFADKARPYFKENEYIKQEIDKVQNGKGDKATKKYMLNKLQNKYTANSDAIRAIVDRQSRLSRFKQQLNADCGKNARRYINGKDLQPLIGLAARLPYAIADQRAADAEQPYAQNSYVPNRTAQSALNTLSSLYYDPSSSLSDLVRVGAQNRYNIANTGNLSSGQKAALMSASNNQLAAQRYGILTDAYNRNAQYKQAYANALMNYGQSEAAREQQALATQQEAYRQAVGAKQKLQAQARKNWYTIANQTLQDFSTNDFYNKLIKLYGNKDEIVLTKKNEIKSNTSNYSSLNYPKLQLNIPNFGYFTNKFLTDNYILQCS